MSDTESNITIKEIVKLVASKYGYITAVAVLAAIETAKAKWTDADTIKYGTEAADALREIV